MANLNTLAIMGRLTTDPELRSTNSGKRVVNFTIAVDGYNDKADFIKCRAWDNTAELICQYYRKGNLIAINGSLITNSYEDKNGYKRTDTEVSVRSAHFCEKKSVPDIDEIPSEDLPF